MNAAQSDQFHWHPAARLFDGQGREHRPGAQIFQMLQPHPSAPVLAGALAASGQGFRSGGAGPALPPADVPMFETLTGGSTGTPRRIRRSHKSWIASFAVNAGLFGIGPGAKVAVLGQLSHSLALYGVIEALYLGAKVHMLDGLRPDRQAVALSDLRVTHLYATPAQLRLMPDGASTAAQLCHVLIGGSKLDRALRDRLTRFAPNAVIHEFYGAAETSFITLSDAHTPDGAVGQPYPGVDIDIRSGEIWVRSPYLFEAYAWDDGSARWHDGWLSVGERGHWNGASLVLSGRSGRMVTVADQNVFPEEIEAFLMAQPGVTHAAAIARPDHLRGCVIVAVVAGDPACEAAILAACRAILGALKSPRTLIWRPEFPLTAAGKTDLAAIERDLA